MQTFEELEDEVKLQLVVSLARTTAVAEAACCSMWKICCQSQWL